MPLIEPDNPLRSRTNGILSAQIRADVELTCFAYDGVLHIKDAMRAGEAVSKGDVIVKMKLVAPPLYVLTTQTLDKDVGIALLNEARPHS